jgi:hypothetical protein
MPLSPGGDAAGDERRRADGRALLHGIGDHEHRRAGNGGDGHQERELRGLHRVDASPQPVSTVLPEREMPGRMAAAWAMPMSSAPPQPGSCVPLLRRRRAGDARTAALDAEHRKERHDGAGQCGDDRGHQERQPVERPRPVHTPDPAAAPHEAARHQDHGPGKDRVVEPRLEPVLHGEAEDHGGHRWPVRSSARTATCSRPPARHSRG